ncbi:MAG: purine-nucleoside phosphorylase [Gemmatimonadetes bacterium]|nr:purine-nucleoside phosphorylase [Gemmatimonadota bacterium]MBK7786021.1 purine-nucleoside phosphorylase [Gemmatimonadota bacterium]MBK9065406.1 purine-nucleoside phosphorylase [Gemmatimonadota bacterium]
MRGLDPVAAAVDALDPWLDGARPEIAIILGSGLGRLTEALATSRRRAYRDVPGFPAAAVAGHAGELVLGQLAGREVLCQSGRFHAYEGHAAPALALPVRVFAALGVRTLILTNAAGGIRRTMSPGSLMLLADQVNLTFRNPLIGPRRDGESRFPDMSAPFDPALRQLARAVARAERIALAEGVYAGVLGPSYETPAEIRMLERLGADAVGMSTVPEVVAARAAGVAVLGISVITNWASGIGGTPLTHAEVMAAAEAAGEGLVRLVTGVVARR